jgi:hypothetical protein
MKSQRNIARKAERRMARALKGADGDRADSATRKRLRKARKSLRKLIRVDCESQLDEGQGHDQQLRLQRHARGQAFSVFALED